MIFFNEMVGEMWKLYFMCLRSKSERSCLETNVPDGGATRYRMGDEWDWRQQKIPTAACSPGMYRSTNGHRRQNFWRCKWILMTIKYICSQSCVSFCDWIELKFIIEVGINLNLKRKHVTSSTYLTVKKKSVRIV